MFFPSKNEGSNFKHSQNMVNYKATIKENREVMEVADETFYRHQRYLEFNKKSLTDILKVIKKGKTKNRATKETKTCNIQFIEFAQEISG